MANYEDRMAYSEDRMANSEDRITHNTYNSIALFQFIT